MRLTRCDKCGRVRKPHLIKQIMIYGITSIDLCEDCYDTFIDKLDKYLPDIKIKEHL